MKRHSAGVRQEEVAPDFAGQRVDNYLLRTLKGVPKSHVYRLLRTGQVRVNGGRVAASRKLEAGDVLRIPPVSVSSPRRADPLPARLDVLFEDDGLVIVAKPAGLAAHGGSGVSAGLIERVRVTRPGRCDLVHRLDRDTSGVLAIATKRSALRGMHELLRAGEVEKSYLAAVAGRWRPEWRRIDVPLETRRSASGERRSVPGSGAAAVTETECEFQWSRFALLRLRLLTGRTHQIRAHLSHLDLPIVGDRKYGDFALNREMATAGFRRMMLHAERLAFRHPNTGKRVDISCPPPPEFADFLDYAGAA